MRLRIGTRGSNLALAQANQVKEALANAHPNLFSENDIEIVPIITTGDKITDRSLGDIGGKGLFTKEIEEALINGSIDLAVHSMKDMPAQLPEGLCFAALLPREDPRDAFLSYNYTSIDTLPKGAIVGTSSTRRKAQLLSIRPDLKVVSFRGNVGTRLDKLKNNLVDATILAVAGLKRLNITEPAYTRIDVQDMLPAVAQGAIVIECKRNNDSVIKLLQAINHQETSICIEAERAFLTKLDGSCKTPIAALARIKDDIITLNAMIASTNGHTIFRTSKTGDLNQARSLGEEAADELLSRAGKDFLSKE
jgi:hydroxymethylbilane synthase